VWRQRPCADWLSFDLSAASGKRMRTIIAGHAEFERHLISERVKSGWRQARPRAQSSATLWERVPAIRRPKVLEMPRMA